MNKLLFTLLLAVAMASGQSSVGTIPLGPGNTLQGLAGTASAVTYTVFGLTTPPGSSSPNYSVLAQGQLGASNAVLYTVPVPGSTFVSLVTLANTTATAVSGVSLGVNGTSATASNLVLSSVTIPPNGSITLNAQGWTNHDVNGNPPTASPLCGSIVAASAAIVNAEALVVACTMPANTMAAGTTFRITAAGSVTTAGTPGNTVFKIRLGTTTLTGNIASTVTAPAVASITAQPFYLDLLVTVRTAGASGTVVGQGFVASTHVTTGAFTSLNIVGITTTAVAVDTTAVKFVELTAITGATDSSVTFQNAAIQVVRL
jgi:hypothetical protein